MFITTVNNKMRLGDRWHSRRNDTGKKKPRGILEADHMLDLEIKDDNTKITKHATYF